MTWNISNFKTATLNGEAITTATGSKEVKQLLANKDFVVVATNFTKSVTTTKTVVVGDWSTSNFGLLTHNGAHWVLNRYEFFQNGVIVNNLSLGSNEIGSYFVYYTNGTCKQFDINNYILNDLVWEFQSNETKLYLLGSNYPWGIYNLSETELSFVEDVYYINLPAKFVRTWRIQE